MSRESAKRHRRKTCDQWQFIDKFNVLSAKAVLGQNVGAMPAAGMTEASPGGEPASATEQPAIQPSGQVSPDNEVYKRWILYVQLFQLMIGFLVNKALTLETFTGGKEQMIYKR